MTEEEMPFVDHVDHLLQKFILKRGKKLEFKNFLQKNHAFIAGDLLYSMVQSARHTDLNLYGEALKIYVPPRYATRLFEREIAGLFRDASLTFSSKSETIVMHIIGHDEWNIIVFKTLLTPLETVRQFPLSVQGIWYDGVNIKTAGSIFDQTMVLHINNIIPKYSFVAYLKVARDIIAYEDEPLFHKLDQKNILPYYQGLLAAMLEDDGDLFLEHIFQWNRMMRQNTKTSLYMCFLFFDPEKQKTLSTLRDVTCFFLKGRDNKHSWRTFISQKSIYATQVTLNVYRIELEDIEQMMFKNRVTMFSKTSLYYRGKDIPLTLLKQPPKNFERQDIGGAILPPTCTDFTATYDEYELSIEEYVNHDINNNLVFFNPPTSSSSSWTSGCYQRANLKNVSSVFYECWTQDSMDTMESVVQDMPYYRLDGIFNFPIYIDEFNYRWLRNNTRTRYFVVIPTSKTLLFSVLERVIHHKTDITSADHCQAGTNKQISIIYPINAATIEDVEKQLNTSKKYLRTIASGKQFNMSLLPTPESMLQESKIEREEKKEEEDAGTILSSEDQVPLRVRGHVAQHILEEGWSEYGPRHEDPPESSEEEEEQEIPSFSPAPYREETEEEAQLARDVRRNLMSQFEDEDEVEEPYDPTH